MSLEWSNLQTFVHDWIKGLQQIVDSIAPDPGADNSMLPLAELPYRFDTTCYSIVKSEWIAPGYDSYSKGYGQQPWLIAFRLLLYNNNLSTRNCTFLGKVGTDSIWNSLNATDMETLKAAGETLYSDNAIEVINNYPTNKIFTTCDSNANVSFYPQLHSTEDIKYRFPKHDGIIITTQYSKCMFKWMNKPYFDSVNNCWKPSNMNDTFFIQSDGVTTSYVETTIAVFDDTYSAQYLVNRLKTNSAHNDVLDVTKAGSAYKMWYGDFYIVYALRNDQTYNFQDLYDGTKVATDAINEWYPSNPPIKTPTYEEVKHEDDPPPVTEDDYIDMGLGVETDGMAMYNMAVLTRDDLIQLIGDFETNADTGLSFLPHVLGLYKLGIESSQLLTTKTDTINLHKEPGKTAFISTDNYNIVDEQLQVIDCGSITVDREQLLTNTYLDFSPYSTYEMFIPGCGWITLPDTVVGRTISVHIVFDLTTCSCKGVVRSEGELLGGSGSTLATVNGIIGSSVPLSINETGLQRGAIMSGAVQTVTALGTSAMGIGIGNPYMGMSGIAMAAGSLAETHIAGNATYTSTKGGATDYSVFGDGYKAVLKITRPKLEIPDNYGHTVGYVVNKYDTLGNYSGFTVCLNPHVTGLTCTSEEKDEIARLLERGVILPSGEE